MVVLLLFSTCVLAQFFFTLRIRACKCDGIFGGFPPCDPEDGGNHHIRFLALVRLRGYTTLDFFGLSRHAAE